MDEQNTNGNQSENDRLDFSKIVDKPDDEQKIIDLWNQGGELIQAGQYAEALPLWEEAIALEEATGYPDLNEDREQLERLRQLLTLSSEDLAAAQSAIAQADAAIDAQLAMLPPELREGVEQQLREFLAMPPEEQDAILANMEETLTNAQGLDTADAEIDVDPNDRPAYLAALWDRGSALVDAGRVEEALPYWEQAVEIAAELNHPQLQHAQQALDYLRQALSLVDEEEDDEEGDGQPEDNA